MSGVRRRRGPPREILDLSKEDKVRVEGAKDLGMIAAERNPVVRTVKDAYDVADALEKIRTGENKSLLKKLRER